MGETAAVRDFYIGGLTHKHQYFMAISRSKKLMLMPDFCTKTVFCIIQKEMLNQFTVV